MVTIRWPCCGLTQMVCGPKRFRLGVTFAFAFIVTKFVVKTPEIRSHDFGPIEICVYLCSVLSCSDLEYIHIGR